MAELLDLSPSRALDLNGLVAAGAKAYFYQSGTTTPITVYSDEGLTTPHPVPLSADASGFFAPVWANTGAIKAVIKTADLGTTLATMDPVYRVSATSSQASAISFEPTAEIAENNVQAAIVNVQAQVAAEETAREQGRGLTLSTPVATTSGGAFDFIGIPSWATEVVIFFNGVSLSGTDDVVISLGTASGFEFTSYVATSAYITDSAYPAISDFTAGFGIKGASASIALIGCVVIRKYSSNNRWACDYAIRRGSATMVCGGGFKSLAGVLTQVRVTRSGSNTFDVGEINVGWR